jgi:uncharacterized membrane protein YbhN (UPF0104 family)
MILAYGIGIALIAVLLHFGGIWAFLAASRLLDLLSRGGVVALTDADTGFFQGVPDLEYAVMAQEPIDWEIIALAALFLVGMWGLKAIQFNRLARYCGIEGSFGAHARAYFYGHGISRLLPFGGGDVATASALQGQGASLERASRVVFLGKIFVAFEVVAFALIGLYLQGLTTWLQEIVWPFVILVLAWVVSRPRLVGRGPRGELGAFEATKRAIRVLAREPRLLVSLCVLSLLAFLFIDEAAFFLAQGFDTGGEGTIVFGIEAGVILMAVVGAHLARLISITPGGIGQYEWGFAAALNAGGVGFPAAVQVAILFTILRYTLGGLIFAVMQLTYGSGTDLSRVTATFRRPAPEGPTA